MCLEPDGSGVSSEEAGLDGLDWPMHSPVRLRMHLVWLLVSLTIVFAPGLSASELDDLAALTQLTETIGPKILAPLSDQAVAGDFRARVDKSSPESAVVLLEALSLLGAQPVAICTAEARAMRRPQAAGGLTSSRGPPRR